MPSRPGNARTRRADHEGTVYLDKRTGTYRAAITRAGLPKLTASGRTKSEALRRVKARLLATHVDELGSATSKTALMLSDLIAAWTRDRAPTLKAGTRHTYTSMLRGLPPELLALPAHALTAATLQPFFRDLTRRLSPDAVRVTYAALRSVCKHAVTHDLLIAVPTGVAMPRVRHEEARWLSLAEVHALLDTARAAGDDYAPLWAFLVGTGVRIGEACGLRWRDVRLDGQAPSVRIAVQLETRGGTPHHASTKRDNVRVIPLVEPALGALYALHGAELPAHPLDLVFRNPTGTHLSEDTVRTRFRKAQARAGIEPAVTPHGLRHTAGSLWLDAGVPLVVVSRLLGHASIAITANIYTHVSEQTARAELARFAAMVGRGGEHLSQVPPRHQDGTPER